MHFMLVSNLALYGGNNISNFISGVMPNVIEHDIVLLVSRQKRKMNKRKMAEKGEKLPKTGKENMTKVALQSCRLMD